MNAMAKTSGGGSAPAELAEFDWLDPFLLAEQLTEEERLAQSAAHEYCQGRLMPRVLEANRHETFDRDIVHEMGRLGLLGSTIPEHHMYDEAIYVVAGRGTCSVWFDERRKQTF